MGLIARRIVMALVALAVAALVVWAMLPQPVKVEVGEVTRGPMAVTVDEDGVTRIGERYVISAPLTGRLLRIELEPGDPVEPNETLLAAIEPRDPDLLDPRAQAEAQARVQSAQAAVRMASANHQKAVAALELAQSELERIRGMAQSNAASGKELDDAQLVVRLREEEVNAARFALQIAEFEPELAKAAQLRTTSDNQQPRNGEPFELRSPCRGRILRVFQESAGVVTMGTPLLEVGDPSDLEIVVDVLSKDAVRIKPGDAVNIEQWGGEGILRGRVRLVEPSAFTKVSALGVEEQRVNVVVDLVDPREQWSSLGDAYRIEAGIVVWSADDVVKVPAGAVFRLGEGWAAFVVREGRAVLTAIEVGRRTAAEVQVIRGIEPGEMVIMHPGDKLADGVEVEVLDLDAWAPKK